MPRWLSRAALTISHPGGTKSRRALKFTNVQIDQAQILPHAFVHSGVITIQCIECFSRAMPTARRGRLRLEGAVLVEPPLEQLIPITRAPIGTADHEEPVEPRFQETIPSSMVDAIVRRLKATDVSYL